jgi:hypothetical protein
VTLNETKYFAVLTLANRAAQKQKAPKVKSAETMLILNAASEHTSIQGCQMV